ncbi:MAG: hypothetical protein LBQ55_06220 [Treponema sp.]|jgi:hypothetical protein|nr:hypothetical protein [Treponema sp.]
MIKDPVTLAHVNMYGVLGALEDLCRFSPEARKLAGTARPLTVGFKVKNGPAMGLRFEGGACTVQEGEGPCDIRLPFGSHKKFNGLIDGTVTPLPSKGFTKIGFLTRNFVGLTKLLESCLRPEAEAMKDPAFFDAGTAITFFLVARTVVQIGNHDRIGRFSASNLPDGTVVLAVAGNPPEGAARPSRENRALEAAITVKDHGLSFSRIVPERYHALMEFSSLSLARRLFDGQVNAIACIGQGLITMEGNLGMLDNVNRILDRAALYLA